MISVRSTAKESPEILLLSLPMAYLRTASFFCRCLGTPQLGMTTIQQGCCFLFFTPNTFDTLPLLCDCVRLKAMFQNSFSIAHFSFTHSDYFTSGAPELSFA